MSLNKFLVGGLVVVNLALTGFIGTEKGWFDGLPTLKIEFPEEQKVAQKPAPQPAPAPKPVPQIAPQTAPQTEAPKAEVPKPVVNADLKTVKDFAIYLSQVSPATVGKSGYDLVIVNVADQDSRLFTKADVQAMKAGGKIVLAQVSLGYAEPFRWYWKKEWNTNTPSWLGEAELGRYPVRQWWNEEWMTITRGIIDRAIAAGFDGIVIDGVDIYIELGASKQLRDRMIDYVIDVAQYAKKQSPGFLIVPKNGEILGVVPQYAQAVDAILKEDLVYASISNGNSGPKNGNDQIVKGIRDLNEFKKSGKPVFVIEYVSGQAWADAKARIKANGFIGYSAPARRPSTIRENVW